MIWIILYIAFMVFAFLMDIRSHFAFVAPFNYKYENLSPTAYVISVVLGFIIRYTIFILPIFFV